MEHTVGSRVGKIVRVFVPESSIRQSGHDRVAGAHAQMQAPDFTIFLDVVHRPTGDSTVDIPRCRAPNGAGQAKIEAWQGYSEMPHIEMLALMDQV